MSNDSKNNDEKGMEGHVYDGIVELDNPLPDWWVWTFIFTVMFAAIYYLHYTSGSGPTLKEELAMDMKKVAQQQQLEPQNTETEEFLSAFVEKDGALNLGKEVYNSKCAACHGVELQGLIGPNLVDKYWLHGKGSHTDILKVVREGVLDKGMPNWLAILKKEESYAVVSYIFSKRNSNPANPKAPQGNWVE